MTIDPVFNQGCVPNWKKAVRVWNRNVNVRSEISHKVFLSFVTFDFVNNLRYSKVSEQLKVYYGQWKENPHVKETLTMTSEACKSLLRTL